MRRPDSLIEYVGGEPILTFDGDYRFLSNFYPAVIEWRGWVWPTVEHAYQWEKDATPERAKQYLALANSPGRVKRIAARGKIRSDWRYVKNGIMYQLLTKKFKHPELRQLLLSTGERWLEEGNSWNDTYWGVCPPGSNTGHNFLGRLLMRVRQEIKNESSICG